MDANELMGWVSSMKRWQKRYRGKLYAVSPRQLGIDQRTRAATRTAANQWWSSKKAEIDEAGIPWRRRNSNSTRPSDGLVGSTG